MILAGFDPGGTTGVCVAKVDRGEFFIIDACQVEWDDRLDLLDMMASINPDVVVVESFRLYAHKAQAQINNSFPSVRVIGLLEAAWHFHCGSNRLWVEQPASVMSRVAVMHAHQFALVNKQHAVSAYKHLRYYFTTKLRNETLKP